MIRGSLYHSKPSDLSGKTSCGPFQDDEGKQVSGEADGPVTLYCQAQGYKNLTTYCSQTVDTKSKSGTHLQIEKPRL